ncbi:MAG: hypothetical protein ACJ79Y_16995 [Myxococcales bacterium]
MRELLDEFGLPSYLKSSGSKGFHILVPLDGESAASTIYPGTRSTTSPRGSHG